MKLFWQIGMAAALACLSFAAEATAFKCSLPGGGTSYQDQPCAQNGAKQETLKLSGSSGSHLVELLGESTAIGIHAGARKGLAEGRISAGTANCLKHIDGSQLYGVYERVLSSEMSAGDLKDANAFFNTPAGRRWGDRMIVQSYMQVGEPAPNPMPVMSKEENDLINAFVATSAGQQLIGKNLIMNTTAMPLILARMSELKKACGIGY